MNADFLVGLAVPASIALFVQGWSVANENRKSNRDVLTKILVQLERHETLFSSIQQDIHELNQRA